MSEYDDSDYDAEDDYDYDLPEEAEGLEGESDYPEGWDDYPEDWDVYDIDVAIAYGGEEQ